MINRNVDLRYDVDGCIFLHMTDPEFENMCEKWGGMVNVKIGKSVEPGTEEQNRAMHALLQAYYITGMHSAPEGCTLDSFKVYMKIQYGPCFDYDYKGHPVKVPKSWADYSKQERMEFIDGLISEVKQSGAEAASAKIREILSGMEANGELKRSQEEYEKTQGGFNGKKSL